MNDERPKKYFRHELRGELRRRRRGLSAAERRRAGHAALRNLLTLIRLRGDLKLAVYLPHGGELDTTPLIELARRFGCQVYVPVVRRARQPMRFIPLSAPLKRNRFGIHEPLFSPHKARDPRTLDIVILPLVGFDGHGERLGSGAGFYDQTFAFLRHRSRWRKPRLIGYAYHWQQVPKIVSERWDVPMNAVVTDRGVHRFTHRARVHDEA